MCQCNTKNHELVPFTITLRLCDHHRVVVDRELAACLVSGPPAPRVPCLHVAALGCSAALLAVVFVFVMFLS